METRTVLVTGASGQLGRRLVPYLIKCGYNVKAHFRSEEKAKRSRPPTAIPVIGDLRNPDWLNGAASGCDVVIHCAAIVSLRPGNSHEMRLVNVEGTRAVIDACLRKNVRRLIYVSTIVTIGASIDGNAIDESAPFNLHNTGIPYIDTKREAEMMALAANGKNLECIVLNPSIMISLPEREFTKDDMRKIPKWIPFYFDFGLNFVETNDVVSGITSAIVNGKPGERYLLTGDNLTAEIAFDLAHWYFSIRKPFIKIPVSFLYPIAVVAEVARKARGKRVKFHRGLARLARHRFIYDNSKARECLGFNPRPLRLFLAEIISRFDTLNLK